MVVGLIFVAAGFFIGTLVGTPANMTATTTGTVSNVHVSQPTRTNSNGSSSSTTCTPVADFVVGGRAFRATSNMGVGPCPWSVGQHVDVVYDPANPATSRVPVKDGLTRFMPWIFGGAGVLAFIGSLFSFVRSVAELGAGGFLLARVWRRRRPTGTV